MHIVQLEITLFIASVFGWKPALTENPAEGKRNKNISEFYDKLHIILKVIVSNFDIKFTLNSFVYFTNDVPVKVSTVNL